MFGKTHDGPEQTNKPMSVKNTKAAQELLAQIANNEINGYFVVVGIKKIDEDHSEATGHAKVTNCNKKQILETSLHAVGISQDDLMLFQLEKVMGQGD